MGDSTSRAKVAVALVGVGPTWDLHYRDAVQRLSSKLSIRAVCDPVLTRAVAVAEEFQATSAVSPWCLTQRAGLHAWLILDPGWFETYPASLAVRKGCAALLANTFSAPLEKLIPVLQQSLEHGELLMPAFPQRFAPATTRLRELMATKLGRVLNIKLTVSVGDCPTVEHWLRENQSEALGLIDWCAWLIGDSVTDVELRTTENGPQLRFQFPTRMNINPPPEATIQFGTSSSETRIVRCEHGQAKMDGPSQIEWVQENDDGCDTFTHERSPYEIILDQFCRRALGGLLPVPTVKHALHAVEIFQKSIDQAGS